MSDNVLGGRYRLQRPLGHGATATVWQACDTRLDRSAAVKILDRRSRADPVALERLRREARSVARLAHDNIVGMYDVDLADDAPYLVMELVDGRSLTEVLTRQSRLPVEQAVSIAAQICDALGAAHAAGVVHRDIKPSNVLVGSSGVVKVCDFGVALLDRDVGDLALTGADTVVGTCQYMAPEQAAGDPVDGRADLYGVGCVLYAMLAGAPPFAAEHPIDLLDMHLNEPPVPLRAHRGDVPPDLHRLVDEMLAKHPADRPATAWSVRDRLRAIGDSVDPEPIAAASPTVTLPAVPGRTEGQHRTSVLSAPRVRRRRRVILAVAGAVTVAVLATTLVSGGDRPDTSGGEPLPAPTVSGYPVAAAPSADPSGIATSSPPTTAATSAPPRTTPIERLAGLAMLFQREAESGRLRPKTAKALLRDLERVVRALDGGRTTEAAERFAEFRDRVSELREDGELADAAVPDLDQIEASLRAG